MAITSSNTLKISVLGEGMATASVVYVPARRHVRHANWIKWIQPIRAAPVSDITQLQLVLHAVCSTQPKKVLSTTIHVSLGYVWQTLTIAAITAPSSSLRRYRYKLRTYLWPVQNQDTRITFKPISKCR